MAAQNVTDSLSEVTSYGNGSTESSTAGFRAAADRAQEKAIQVTDRVAERAHSTVEGTKRALSDQFETTKRALTGQIDCVVAATRAASDRLRTDEQSMLAQHVQRLGDGVGRVSTYLDSRTPAELVDDVEDFARKRPAVFLGTAFLLGMAAARFIKSSADANRVGAPSGFGDSEGTRPERSYGTT